MKEEKEKCFKMEELQQQILNWCQELTVYLKCDQCDRKLVKDIYLCEIGHLICFTCSQGSSPSDKCSICQKKYTKTRNYLAENLSRKMEMIIEKIGSTDDDDDLKSVCSEAGNWNVFFCRIAMCKFQGSIDEIRQHYQENHTGLYVKVDTIRIPKNILSKKGLFVPRAHNLQVELANFTKFTCHIELDRKTGNPEEKPSSEPKKKPQKNRNKLTNGTQQNEQEKLKNRNQKKPNAEEKQNPDGKGENGKKKFEKKSSESQNHQVRMNNPLQTSGGNIPPFGPMNCPGGPQIGYQPPNAAFNYSGVPQGLPPQGLQHNLQHFGAPQSAFPGANPHYRPPPSPGTPGIPGARYGHPSAPVEDGAHVVYPDLTKMKHKMDDRFSEVQTRIAEKERARLARKSSVESKDKCVIS